VDAGALRSALLALLEQRPGPPAAAVAEAVRDACGVEHVGVVAVDGEESRVLAAVGPQLLSAGTSSPAAVSSRMVTVVAGRVWAASDLRTEPGFDRPIDQMGIALGLRSGAGVPLQARGATVGGVLLSSTTAGREWLGEVAAISSCAGLLLAALGLGRDANAPLRVVVVHGDPLTAHGLARIVELGLPAEVAVATGAWDPRLPELTADADAIVADVPALDALGPADGQVVVHDGPPPRHGIPVERAAAVASLVAAVAAAASGARPGRRTGGAPTLSARERDLLRELASGRSYKEIAARLSLSVATVRGYSRGLYAKLDVHSRAEAVAKAGRTGL
jgi:DNA-binding CsgD family transcriptional regulator